MSTHIIDRGRGPEIEGTRITVYDVMDYLLLGWSAERIAPLFNLTVDQVQAAIDYIEAHRTEVEAGYQQIVERHENYRYPPDVQEKLAISRQAFQARVAEIRGQGVQEQPNAVPHGR